MKKFVIVALLAFSGLAYGQGKFSGLMFGDYSYSIARDANFSSLSNNVASPSGGTAFQEFKLRRIYFAYDNDISEQFTTRFRLEIDQAANTSNGKIGSYVKDAYLRWKNVFAGSDLYFGIQPTPAYDVSEGAWGYRAIEKTIMDLRGIVPSRDQGIALRGKVTGDGMVNYWVMFANGSGNSPETDKYKRYYAHLQLKPATNLQATLYVDYNDRADVPDSYNAGSTLSNSIMTTAAFVGYSEPSKYNIGVEAFLQSTSNGLKDTLAKAYSSKNGIGISVWGSYNLSPELALVVRYDNYNPSSDDAGKDPAKVTASVANSDLARNYVIAGLAWKVDKNVSVIPNVLYETYETPKGGNSINASLTGRVTFYYVFL